MPVRGNPRAYYCAAARSAGVPELWIDDAASDMALALWLDGKADDVLAIRRRAIDAARRYGPRTRYGGDRTTVALDKVMRTTVDSYLGLLLLDIRRASRVLTVKQRRALRRRMAGLPMTDVQSTHASAARRALRKALAA